MCRYNDVYFVRSVPLNASRKTIEYKTKFAQPLAWQRIERTFESFYIFFSDIRLNAGSEIILSRIV